MNKLSMLELLFFIGLFVLERLKPAREFPVYNKWYRHCIELIFFGSIWLGGFLLLWPAIPALSETLHGWSFWSQVLLTYLVFSFVAYWYHRLRHSIPLLWHYIHYMHHAPSHMDTPVTFWRHPLEMILDSLVVLAVGKLLGVGVQAIIGVLIIESTLEIFHHANIHTPRYLRWLGYFLQLPEQHLVHHQRGVHRWNYGTVSLWDALFGTLNLPETWHGRVGLPEWNNTKKLLFFRY